MVWSSARMTRGTFIAPLGYRLPSIIRFPREIASPKAWRKPAWTTPVGHGGGREGQGLPLLRPGSRVTDTSRRQSLPCNYVCQLPGSRSIAFENNLAVLIHLELPRDDQ